MVLDFGLALGGGLFPNSEAAGEGITAPIVNQIIWKDVGVGIVPIGSVVAWFKSIAGCPPLLPNYVECNGQVLADGDSPLNGQTIPNLNGSNYFLRGNATSGTTGGLATAPNHTHTISESVRCAAVPWNDSAAPAQTTSDSGTHNNQPPYTNVVWVMRIK